MTTAEPRATERADSPRHLRTDTTPWWRDSLFRRYHAKHRADDRPTPGGAS